MSADRPAPAGATFMPQLDGLRALAVGVVLVHHLLDKQLLPSLLRSLPFGFFGVRLFFVLSGFLITGILLRARDAVDAHEIGHRWALRQFFARRVLRIFPLYYFVIAVCVVVNVPPVREEFWWLASYLYNYRVASLGWWQENIAHFWSLAVEEQYYLIWPWIVLFAPRHMLRLIGVGMVLIGPLTRSALIAAGIYELAPYVITPVCLDSLGMGALLAMATRGAPASTEIVTRLTRTALPVGLLLAIVLSNLRVPYSGQIHMILYDTALSLIFVWLVASASRGFSGFVGSFLTWEPVAYCGRIAYGIYVYHVLLAPPVFMYGLKFGAGWKKDSLPFFLLTSLVTVAVAAVSWHLLERPLNDLKRHFPYRPPAAIPALPSSARTHSLGE